MADTAAGQALAHRGVFEDVDPLPGTRSFRIVASSGTTLMTVAVVESCVQPGFVANLWRWLERHDRQLKLI